MNILDLGFCIPDIWLGEHVWGYELVQILDLILDSGLWIPELDLWAGEHTCGDVTWYKFWISDFGFQISIWACVRMWAGANWRLAPAFNLRHVKVHWGESCEEWFILDGQAIVWSDKRWSSKCWRVVPEKVCNTQPFYWVKFKLTLVHNIAQNCFWYTSHFTFSSARLDNNSSSLNQK